VNDLQFCFCFGTASAPVPSALLVMQSAAQTVVTFRGTSGIFYKPTRLATPWQFAVCCSRLRHSHQS
jgi:hypothetical protein